MKHPVVSAIIVLAPAFLGAQGAPRPTPAAVAAPATALPLKLAPQLTSADITAKDLMTRLYIFADDSMMGREAGTAGSVKGTDYLAREAKRIGLVPAGDSGTYFQTLPFKTRIVDSASILAAGGASLAFGTEWVGSGNASAALSNLQVVYGGTLGDSSSMISVGQGTGKLVVFAVPEGPAAYRAMRGAARMAPAAAVVAMIASEQMLNVTRRPTTFLDDPPAATAVASKPVLLLTRAAAATLFDAPPGHLAPGAAGKTASLDLRVRLDPVQFPSRNVVAVLPGSDPTLARQYVAIGAHSDHVGFNSRPVDHDSLLIYNHIVRPGGAEDAGRQATPEQLEAINARLAAWRVAHPGTARMDSIANGADDDGSGSVTMLEIAEKLASFRTRPKRSILFVWHVAEEKGLIGAAYFTNHPTVPRDSIVAQLNLDMVGRGNAWDVTGETKDGQVLRGSADYLQLVGSRRLSTELGDLIEKANAEGEHGFTFDYSMDANGHPMNIYCRSDHYEYARYGIPVTFLTTGGHSDYHQVTDEPQYIDYDRLTRVASLVQDIAVRVANLDHRIAVDQAKPDPRGACRQ